MEPEWLAYWQKAPQTHDFGLKHFDALPPVDAQDMRERWHGSGLHSGHPLDGLLEAYGWYGKAFHDTEEVDPLLFGTADKVMAIAPAYLPLSLALRHLDLIRSPISQKAFRLIRPLLHTSKPAARLRMVAYRGLVSAAMIYDRQPIIDHFRRIDDRRVLGDMDLRQTPQPFFFLLERENHSHSMVPGGFDVTS